MHPEIRKFWEKDGKEVIYLDKPIGQRTNVPMYLVDGVIVACPYIDGDIVYYLMGQWYCEEMMLRLVKLKAFL
jgi:hypothetical protein